MLVKVFQVPGFTHSSCLGCRWGSGGSSSHFVTMWKRTLALELLNQS